MATACVASAAGVVRVSQRVWGLGATIATRRAFTPVARGVWCRRPALVRAGVALRAAPFHCAAPRLAEAASGSTVLDNSDSDVELATDAVRAAEEWSDSDSDAEDTLTDARPMIEKLESLQMPDEYSPEEDPLLNNLLFDLDAVCFTTTQTLNFPAHMNPVDRKAKLQVLVANLQLTKQEAKFFRAIIGPRYRSDGSATFTCSVHPTVRANKRALLELLQASIIEAKRLAAEFPKQHVRPPAP